MDFIIIFADIGGGREGEMMALFSENDAMRR